MKRIRHRRTWAKIMAAVMVFSVFAGTDLGFNVAKASAASTPGTTTHAFVAEITKPATCTQTGKAQMKCILHKPGDPGYSEATCLGAEFDIPATGKHYYHDGKCIWCENPIPVTPASASHDHVGGTDHSGWTHWTADMSGKTLIQMGAGAGLVQDGQNFAISGNVVLDGDVDIKAIGGSPEPSIEVKSGTSLTICLNGHKLTLPAGLSFTVDAGATLNIFDPTDEGIIAEKANGSNYPSAVSNSGTVNMYGGKIELLDGYNTTAYGVNNKENGILNLYKGSIVGNEGNSATHIGVENYKGTVNLFSDDVSIIINDTTNGYGIKNTVGTVNVYSGTIGGTPQYGIYTDGGTVNVGGSAVIEASSNYAVIFSSTSSATTLATVNIGDEAVICGKTAYTYGIQGDMILNISGSPTIKNSAGLASNKYLLYVGKSNKGTSVTNVSGSPIFDSGKTGGAVSGRGISGAYGLHLSGSPVFRNLEADIDLGNTTNPPIVIDEAGLAVDPYSISIKFYSVPTSEGAKTQFLAANDKDYVKCFRLADSAQSKTCCLWYSSAYNGAESPDNCGYVAYHTHDWKVLETVEPSGGNPGKVISECTICHDRRTVDWATNYCAWVETDTVKTASEAIANDLANSKLYDVYTGLKGGEIVHLMADITTSNCMYKISSTKAFTLKTEGFAIVADRIPEASASSTPPIKMVESTDSNGHKVYTFEQGPMCSIGDIEYATLAEAIAAYQEGQTIVMQSDFKSNSSQDSDYYINTDENKPLVIDLNGHTYAGKIKGSGTLYLSNGKLGTGSGDYAIARDTYSGDLHLGKDLVIADTSGLTTKGNVIYESDFCAASASAGYMLSSGGSITVKEGATVSQINTNRPLTIEKNATILKSVTLTGTSTITITIADGVTIPYLKINNANVTINIGKAKFTGTGKNIETGSSYGGIINVDGAVFEGYVDLASTDKLSATFKNCTFTSNPYGAIKFAGKASVELDNCVIKAGGDYGIYSDCYNGAAGSFIINNCDITAGKAAIQGVGIATNYIVSNSKLALASGATGQSVVSLNKSGNAPSMTMTNCYVDTAGDSNYCFNVGDATSSVSVSGYLARLNGPIAHPSSAGTIAIDQGYSTANPISYMGPNANSCLGQITTIQGVTYNYYVTKNGASPSVEAEIDGETIGADTIQDLIDMCEGDELTVTVLTKKTYDVKINRTFKLVFSSSSVDFESYGANLKIEDPNNTYAYMLYYHPNVATPYKYDSTTKTQIISGIKPNARLEFYYKPTIGVSISDAVYGETLLPAMTGYTKKDGETVDFVYYTDAACTTKTTTAVGASSAGKAPKKVGKYYVKSKLTCTDYTVESEPAEFNITKKDIVIKPTANQSKVYGEADPTFAYTADGIVSGDLLSGALGRATGENVGTYAYTLGTIEDLSGNYNVSLQTSGVPTFAITQKEVGLTWSNTEFTYDGNSKLPSAAVTAGQLIGTDTCTVTVKAADAKTAAGTGYTANVDSISNSNYKVKEADKSVTWKIVKAGTTKPTGLTAVNETYSKQGNGKVTGLTTAMEYKKSTDESYTAVTDANMTFAVGTYDIRMKGDANHDPSEAVQVTFEAGPKIYIANALVGQSDLTYSVDKPEGYDYGDEAKITFKPAAGFSFVEGTVIKLNGTPIDLEDLEDGVYTIASITESIQFEVTGIVDDIEPTVEVKVGENTWTEFSEEPEVLDNLYGKQTLSIEASDEGSGIASVEYFVSDMFLSLEQVKALDDEVWTEYTDEVTIEAPAEVVFYVKVTDMDGNIAYISSGGLLVQYEDIEEGEETREDYGSGEIVTEVNKDASVPDVEIANLDVDLAMSILSEEELEAVDNGATMKIYVEVVGLDETVTDDEKEAIYEIVGDDGVVGAYFDISLFKRLSTDTQGTRITDTDGQLLEIEIAIPEDLINTNDGIIRTFDVIRVHDGVAESMQAVLNPDKMTLTFKTDKFSTYAITYADEAIIPPDDPVDDPVDDPTDDPSGDSGKTSGNDKAPLTYDAGFTMVLVTMFIALAFAGIIVVRRREER